MSRETKIQVADSLATFFRDEVQNIARKQGVDVTPVASQYLAKLLEKFSSSESFFEDPLQKEGSEARKGKSFPALAQIWLESLHRHPSEQYILLQQLGDVALFTSGFLQDKIKSSVVDMDYYMAMGGQAYERAAHLRESISSERALNVFFELAGSFRPFAEVLAEISDQKFLGDERSLVKLYEKWLDNKSARIARMLTERGIIPHAPTSEDK